MFSLTKNLKILVFALVVSLVFMSCRSSQEVVPAPQPEPVVEVPYEPVLEPMPEQEPAPVTEAAITSLNQIHFDFDKSNLDAEAQRLLRENARKLADNPTYQVRVEAFTDYVGTDQYNLRLSVRRANSVRDFYAANGVSVERITAVGLGVDPNPCMTRIPGDRGCREMRRAHSEPIAPFRASAQ